MGALGAPEHGGGDVAQRGPAQFEPWLDHLVGLGCNGLLLGPVFHSATHGYDTLDHYRIDARLGDDADFDRLVAGCRERGIRILLDGEIIHGDYPAFIRESHLDTLTQYETWKAIWSSPMRSAGTRSSARPSSHRRSWATTTSPASPPA